MTPQLEDRLRDLMVDQGETLVINPEGPAAVGKRHRSRQQRNAAGGALAVVVFVMVAVSFMPGIGGGASQLDVADGGPSSDAATAQTDVSTSPSDVSISPHEPVGDFVSVDASGTPPMACDVGFGGGVHWRTAASDTADPTSSSPCDTLYTLVGGQWTSQGFDGWEIFDTASNSDQLALLIGSPRTPDQFWNLPDDVAVAISSDGGTQWVRHDLPLPDGGDTTSHTLDKNSLAMTETTTLVLTHNVNPDGAHSAFSLDADGTFAPASVEVTGTVQTFEGRTNEFEIGTYSGEDYFELWRGRPGEWRSERTPFAHWHETAARLSDIAFAPPGTLDNPDQGSINDWQLDLSGSAPLIGDGYQPIRDTTASMDGFAVASYPSALLAANYDVTAVDDMHSVIAVQLEDGGPWASIRLDGLIAKPLIVEGNALVVAATPVGTDDAEFLEIDLETFESRPYDAVPVATSEQDASS